MSPSDKPGPDEALHLIPEHGGYRRLRSFHAALAAYDATVRFCDRFIDRRSRTHDQMVQAGRVRRMPTVRRDSTWMQSRIF
jgi:hypothetical protein